MFDDEWLYLAIRTSFQPSFGTQRVYFPGDSERDGFRFSVESEEKQILRVNIVSDGHAYGVRDLPSCRPDRRTKEQIADDIRQSCGLEIRCNVDGYSGVTKGVWTCEVRVPLARLETMGNAVFVHISGKKYRIRFAPESRSIVWVNPMGS